MISNKKLYLITPEKIDTPTLFEQCLALIDTCPAFFQYRVKMVDPATKLHQAKILLAHCRRAGVPFIVNDDWVLAKMIGADGVHLGKDDVSILQARAALGKTRIIGASCYGSIDRGVIALADGADYIAFGAAFSSKSKPEAPCVSLSLYEEARGRFPDAKIVAIGGITLDRAPLLLDAGVDYLAVIGDIFDADDPVARARAYENFA